MACDYETEYRCGDGEHNLLKKILGRLRELVGLASTGGGDTVTLTVSDIEIGAVEIKDGDTDARAKVITTCPLDSDRGLVVRNIPCGIQEVSGPFLTDAQLRASAVAISAASLPLPAGAATEATLSLLQGNVIFYLPSIDNYLANIFSLIRTTCPSGADAALAVRNIPCGTQAVTGPLTDAQLRASAVPVSISGSVPVSFGTFMTTCPVGTESGLIVRAVPCGTQAVSAASLPLPTGAATEATLNGLINVTDAINIALDTYWKVDNDNFVQTIDRVTPVGYILDEVAGTALTENDVGAARMDSKRAQVFVIEDATTRGQRAAVSAAGALQVEGVVSTKTALTASAPTFASVGVASAQAVAAAATRKGLVLVNVSSNRISIAFGATAVLDSGITLFPGDSFNMEEYCFSTAAINAIAFGAASRMAIQEFTT